MKILFEQIDLSFVMLFLGCILVGYGLFLLHGLGFALACVGAILLFLGLLSSLIEFFGPIMMARCKK